MQRKAKYAASVPHQVVPGKRHRSKPRTEPENERRKRYIRELRKNVIEGYGGKCVCCGNTYIPHLTIDHINNNGKEERLKYPGTQIYRRLRRENYSDPSYQILCFNCNWAKYHLGECLCSNIFVIATRRKRNG